MISRCNAWILLAIPIAVILLWASRGQSIAPTANAPTAFSSISGSLLYLAPASGSADLFAYDLISQQSSALTDGAQISAYHASVDGKSIYYTAQNQSGGADIWNLQLVNRSQNMLINCAQATCDAPQASIDGRYLAYQRQDASSPLPQIWLHNLENNEQNQISLAGQSAFQPQWALDGRLIFYNQSLGAYESLLPGSEARLRVPNALGDPLSWQPDGETFVASEAFPSTSEILRGTSGEVSLQTPDPQSQSALEITVSALLRYSGESQQSLFDYGEELIEDAAPIFSPDGRWLAFTRKYLDQERWSPGRQLWLLNIESGELLQLSNTPSYQFSKLAWSADSSQIAFVRSNRTDFNQPPELWLIERDGSSAQLLAVDAFAPHWLP
jgi:Tol biopolymer transport system component